MRRYTIEVGGRRRVIDVEELSADRFRVVLDGQELDVALSAAEDVPEAVISPEIVPARAPADAYRPPPAESLEPVPATAPPPLPSRPPLPHDEFRGELQAPMPGTVVSVHAAPGDTVPRGHVLVKLEAMKMTNALRAPCEAVVAEVRVGPGQAVGYGDVLMTFRTE